MGRVSIILVVALFCLLNAPAPDPRIVAAINAAAQDAAQPPLDFLEGKYYCPMDSDIRSDGPGVCPRCGMTLVQGVRDIAEYPIHLTVDPPAPRAAEVARLTFGIIDPATLKPVRDFEVVHEKLYHLFVVSQDLTFFLHSHPKRQPDEDFHIDVRFPKPGMYRVLSDFYPSGGTPQLITNTVMIGGDGFSLQPAHISADTSPRQTENSRVELEEVPQGVAARQKVSLFFRITPDQEIQPYLGAMAHMLAASSDLIDMMHNHPFQSADGKANAYKELEFNMIFPRAGVYRVWIQFQRQGVVNTAAFDVPVSEPNS